ncbi:MAG: hypothetical protein C0609_09055 [Deltaproteobacteria bacterium]|nr:MAG: hypothetical protein C0609_09055 [Deltaproteobacteria bacterium]
MPGETDFTKKNEGPIPPGKYLLDTDDISWTMPWRSFLGDWGNYRAPLHPLPGTDTHGREGFFLHGGCIPGSAGCIDVGEDDNKLFPKFEEMRGVLPLWVE